MKPPVLLSSYDTRLQAAASARNSRLRQERHCQLLPKPSLGPLVRKCPVGVVIVDMQYRPLSYGHGSFEDGIARLGLLLDTAKKFGIPCMAVETEGSGMRTLPEIAGRLSKGTKTFIKAGDSAFSAGRFQLHLVDLGINTLVLCGHSPQICVRATASGALIRGYSLITSDELLFGGDRFLQHFYLPFYKRKTEYYDTTAGVLAALGRHILVDARSGGAPMNSPAG